MKTVTHEEVDSEFLGGALTHTTKSGVAHLAAPDEAEALDAVRRILVVPAAEQPERSAARRDAPIPPTGWIAALDDVVPDDPRKPYDMHDVIGAIVDDGAFLEIQPGWAPNIIIGFARLGGRSVGIVAQQPAVLAGALDIDASIKAARFVRTCDCFNVPLVTFVDVPGFLPGVAQEHGGIIKHGAKLLYAYCEATVPKLTVITRKAYGGAYDVMSSKHIRGDMNFAWPTAEIAVMGAEGAVNIIFKDAIAAADDPVAEHARLVAEYEAEFANPYIAAARGYVDEVIQPSETRPRLIRALEILADKRDTNPQEEAWQHPALRPRARLCAKTGRDATAAPFRRVLVANRGEIAVRIIRACHELGMEAVAVYSDADAEAPHVRLADVAVRIGPPPPTESYLRIDAIIEAARATGAEAIHPGLRLPGRAGGLRPGRRGGRARLRRAAVRVDRCARRQAPRPADGAVGRRRRPCPGRSSRRRSTGPTRSPRSSPRPRRIGFPLLVKAAAGGGGRGHAPRRRAPRTCRRRWSAGSREAASAFGDGSVYLEREIVPGPPHRGPAARRRDGPGRRARGARLLAPAPPPEARRGGAGAGPHDRPASRAARAWRSGSRPRPGLRNAATAEFLRAPDGSFYFLEVNTRLQVEHGVTELVSGLDIVREQFWLAAGRAAVGGGPGRRGPRRRARTATRSRSGSPPRTRPATSRRRPAGSAAG